MSVCVRVFACVCVCVYIFCMCSCRIFVSGCLYVILFSTERVCIIMCVCASVGMFVNAGWATELQRTNRTS